MERSTNALAELAKWLECDIRMIEFGNVAQLKRLSKAKRIVAELAKVMPSYMAGKPGHSFIETEAYKAYRNCRAIAEEGVKDGR